MREIKFRAWDGHQKTMVNQESCFPFTLITQYGLLRLDPRQKENNYQKIDREYVLMQYTGLKDRHGKEIYEGDIYHMGDPKITYTVVWSDSGLIGKQIGNRIYAGIENWKRKIEVIGNIYQHPNLLK